MKDPKKEISPEDVHAMLRTTGLTLNAEQIENTVKSQGAFDDLVERVRAGIAPTDEPAFVFHTPNTLRNRL